MPLQYTTTAKQLCAAAKSGCQVGGSPDSFADVLQADGRPGRVVSADEAEGYQQVHFSSKEFLGQTALTATGTRWLCGLSSSWDTDTLECKRWHVW